MKKRINSAIALLAVTSVMAVSVTAAENRKYSPDDLRGLANYLYGDETKAVGVDVNEDGYINVFDLVFMRKYVDLSGSYNISEIKASEKNVRYIGRNAYIDDTAWLVQSGSAVEFTVTGRSAEVTLKGDSSRKSGEDYRSRYAVIVDGEIIKDSTMGSEKETVELFSGETLRTAKVKIIHLSEANNGAVSVGSIKVDSNVLAPVIPTASKELCIEFIGDSITCAYGVEGKSSSESFKTTTENFMKSYAYLTAEKLDADYSAVSYSGHGIVSGYTSDGVLNTGSLVPPYYEQVGSWKEYSQEWDFNKRKNDVVVINLGTNDNTYVSKDMDTRGPEFVEKYVEFLKMVRKNNPNAKIICTVGTMGCAEMYPLIEQAIEEFCSATGDKGVTSYLSAVQLQSDGIGSDWHPSPVTHQKSAYVLADKICQVLGIESDQIGLDMAAEAEYRLIKNESAGANAWPYFSDYDRSYNINVVTGGEVSSDLEAAAAPIELRKGGMYRITFKCTGTNGGDIPVIIRSADGKKEYFSGTLKGSADTAEFDEEFTAAESCADAEIVFQIGGKDSRNLTIRELRIEKTK